MKKMIAIVLIAVMMMAVACAGAPKVSGTVTQTINSKDYYAAQEVKNDMPENEMRPDGSNAMVGFRRLMPMLDTRTEADVAQVTGGDAPATPGVENYYTATLTLKDGKYSLEKSYHFDREYVFSSVLAMLLDDETPTMQLTFSGSYTVEKDGTVILAAPESVYCNVAPCGQASAYSRFGGGYEDVTETVASETEYPGKFLYYFNTPYFVVSEKISAQSVTVDTANGTMTIK
jgi:hypothetical protein